MVGVFQWFLFLSVVCSLDCENSGVPNSTSCSCDCMESYTGPTCGGIYVPSSIVLLWLLTMYLVVCYLRLFHIMHVVYSECTLECLNGGSREECACICANSFLGRDCSG